MEFDYKKALEKYSKLNLQELTLELISIAARFDSDQDAGFAGMKLVVGEIERRLYGDETKKGHKKPVRRKKATRKVSY